MTRKIAFINQKGGVGKTTLVANCGAYWARNGRRVLLVDLDAQAHLTLHLGTAADLDRINLYRVFRGELDIADAIVHIPGEGLDLLPSHIDLSAAEWEFGQEVGREMLLRDRLRLLLKVRAYDLVLVDCPPSLGFLSLNALAAVDDVVIPVQAEFFALQGMAQLLKVIELVRERLHSDLEWRAIVPTLVDLRTNLGREVIAELERHFPGKVTRSLLTKRIKVAEAPSFGKSIFEYAGNSEGAVEFANLAVELEHRLALPPAGAKQEPAAREAGDEAPAEGVVPARASGRS
ncbi:MAG: ParA family protein [Planctomycetota bacterium]